MALKALMLKHEIDLRKKELEALIKKDEELQTRESELTAAIEEATTEEEMKTVGEEIDLFNTSKDEHEKEKKALEGKIASLEAELEEEEVKQDTTPSETPVEQPKAEERKVEFAMDKRNVFANITITERDAMMNRDEVKAWLGEVRSAMKEKRAIQNIGLTIPEVFLGYLRQNIENYSKLIGKVMLKRIGGEGRLVVGGNIPEAVWTECCANLNELDLSFSDITVDCFKVGGYFTVCNANLTDSDLDLASEILSAIGQAIGYALDKAILYGRNSASNSKMPLGVVARLAQTSQPESYPATARAWADLHTTNILTIANTVTELPLFKTILADSSVISDKYSKESITWIMNKTTKSYLLQQAMSINAAGAIVSGIGNTMPIIGGDIVELDFVPNYVIIAGHFDNYLLAERQGKEFATSEHAFFLQDRTAFKGTARYDGSPVIAEAFAAIGVNGTTPTADMSFVADKANVVSSLILNKNQAAITGTATVQLKATILPDGAKGTITWASSASTYATVSSTGLVTGVTAGSTVITATCGDAVAVCNVTVS